MVDQVESLDLADDGKEQDRFGRIAHPGIKLSVWFIWPQHRITVIIPRSLCLLRESDNIRWGLQVPVLVCPELACGPDTCLHLIHDHKYIMLLCDLAQASEIRRRRVIVSTLGLDRFNDNSDYGAMPAREDALCLLEAPLFLCIVRFHVLFQRVSECRERCLWPIKRWNVNFVDGFAASGTERAEEAAMETFLEAHKSKFGGTWYGIAHCALELFGSKLGTLASLPATVVHESCLVRGFVGVGTSQGGEDLVETRGCDRKDAVLENVVIVSRREIAKGGAVDDGVYHLLRLGGCSECGVVVPHGYGRDLSVARQ